MARKPKSLPDYSTALWTTSARLGINSCSASDFELVTWVAIMEPK